MVESDTIILGKPRENILRQLVGGRREDQDFSSANRKCSFVTQMFTTRSINILNLLWN